MPRLLDDIRSMGKLEKPWFVRADKESIWAAHAAELFQLLDDPMPVLLIDNVAEYYFTGTDQEQWNIDRDFPNLAPPFPAFWAEHRMPSLIHSKECGDTDVKAILPLGGRVGMMVRACDPKDVKGEGIPANVKWILWAELFVDYGQRPPQGPHGSIFLAVDAEGALVENPWMQSFVRAEDAEIMQTLMTWLYPMLLTVSFLHCKNVAIVDHAVDRPLAKKWHARHGIWPTTYKTLVIEPLKQILRREGGADKVGIQRAMHICRGHFKDYREGRGLFGKYHQLIWQPSLVRGTKGKAAPREIEVKI
jgi:hypothetical protein